MRFEYECIAIVWGALCAPFFFTAVSRVVTCACLSVLADELVHVHTSHALRPGVAQVVIGQESKTKTLP